MTVERLKALSHTKLAIPIVMKLEEEEEEAPSTGLQALSTEVEALVAPKADDYFLQLLGRKCRILGST